MKQKIAGFMSAALTIILSFSAMSAFAADGGRAVYIAPNKTIAVSNRLIVRLKSARLAYSLNGAQLSAELIRPFSADTMRQLQTAAGVTITELHVISNGAHVIIVQGGSDKNTLRQAISNIGKLSNVDYVEEDQILTAQAVPNDAAYGNLWGLKPVSPVASPAPGETGNYGADFQSAWDITAGNGVVVAVIDTGITAHEDIVGVNGSVSPATGNLVSPGYDFISDCRIRGTCPVNTADTSAVRLPVPNASDTGDFVSVQDMLDNPNLFPPPPAPATPAQTNSSWHGTHVAGTIAALGNNAIGVIGGAYAARILPIRVLGKGGGYSSDTSEGIRWAANAHASINNPNPARVINLSLGGSGSCSITRQEAIDAAVAKGAVIVVAAGNENTDVANASPANCNNVISVAAVAKDGSRAYYSNVSSPASNATNPVQITLAAQGSDKSLTGFDPGIYSSINSGTTTAAASAYAFKQGTSMATPHVAAAAALMLAHNPALTPLQVKNILAASVTPFPSFAPAGWAAYDCATLKNCGTGILNAQLAVLNSSVSPLTASVNAIDFGSQSLITPPVSKTLTLTNITGAAVTLTATTITGVNSASFSISANTCTGFILPSATCDITLSYLPKTANTNSAQLLVVAQAVTAGAVVVGLKGLANLPVSAETALAATKSSGGSGGGGGCSIMPATENPDISLLLTLFLILAYSFRHRINLTIGKN